MEEKGGGEGGGRGQDLLNRIRQNGKSKGCLEYDFFLYIVFFFFFRVSNRDRE